MDSTAYGGTFNKWTEKHKKIQVITDFCKITSSEIRKGNKLWTDNIKKIPKTLRQTIKEYPNVNYQTEIVIEKIIDGDTFIISYIVTDKLYKMFSKNNQRYGIINVKKFRRLRCMIETRLYGLDASEKECFEGQLMTLLIKRKIRNNNGYLYAIIHKFNGDAYNRDLTTFYLDKKYKNRLYPIEILSNNKESTNVIKKKKNDMKILITYIKNYNVQNYIKHLKFKYDKNGEKIESTVADIKQKVKTLNIEFLPRKRYNCKDFLLLVEEKLVQLKKQLINELEIYISIKDTFHLIVPFYPERGNKKTTIMNNQKRISKMSYKMMKIINEWDQNFE